MGQVNATVSPDGLQASIAVVGRFDFSMHASLRDLAKKLRHGARCVVDLSEVTYMDSSALGMLLVLRETAPDTVLRGAQTAVRRVLDIASFGQIFKVE